MGDAFSWIRNKISAFFYRFGVHCATHQIRLILISGLVITSLFYPALWIYSSTGSRQIPGLPSRILYHPFASDLFALTFFEDDLENVWSGHDALRIVDNIVARARCGFESTIRIERVLLTSDGFESDTGVINHQMLMSALSLESALLEYISLNHFRCLKLPSGKCLILSPMEYWSHDELSVKEDDHLLHTINSQQNLSASGLPLRSTMVFAGRESREQHRSALEYASHLALTFFFHEDDCTGSIGHNTWLKALNSISASFGCVSATTQEPTLLELEFSLDTKVNWRMPLITITLYISYIIFFIYFSGSMRRMDTVHSRIGLCFTGLVEILVSTITSLSVCAIVGVRITLVPWGIFPIVIVFVGAENMFRLIDDVVKTSISLPVKERVGVGLSRAGTSNTFKVVSYNAILGIISVFTHGAIRQFCIFAIVVLVAHWFLIHTFFVAVLSIDLQRLELDDLLRQDTTFPSSAKLDDGDLKQTTKATPTPNINNIIRTFTKGRVARNVSLCLLLAIAATLYFSTLPSPKDSIESSLPHMPRSAGLRSKVARMQHKPDMHADARRIWLAFNTDDVPLVHLRIEKPVIVTLDHKLNDAGPERRVLRPWWSIRVLRPLWWICRVIFIPIGATLGCLYLLLLYLLKDTDRLEGQKESNGAGLGGMSPIEDQPSFSTIPRLFASDVGLLASNGDGSILAAVSLEGEFYIWLASSQRSIKVATEDVILQNASSSPSPCAFTAIAVDESGSCVVLGTNLGDIAIWDIEAAATHLLAHYVPEGSSSSVTHIKIVACPYSSRNSSQDGRLPELFATYKTGAVIHWLDGCPSNYSPTHSQAVTAKLLDLPDVDQLVICFFHEDGSVEITSNVSSTAINEPVFIPAGTPGDQVVDAYACLARIEEESHMLLAASTSAGIISIWDTSTGECITTLDDTYGPLNSLRLIPTTVKACSQCGEFPLCSFSLVYSIGHVVFVDRGILARRCSCPQNQLLVSKLSTSKDSSTGRRSRSGSFVSSSGAEVVSRTRSRHVSVSSDVVPDVGAFPVSGHGVHSRRGLDKDHARRNSDKFADRPTFIDANSSPLLSPMEESQLLAVPEMVRTAFSQPAAAASSNLWWNFKLMRLCEATCERGGWDISNNKILGLRRKPRRRHYHEDNANKKFMASVADTSSLSISVLDRWEVWLIDPSKASGLLQASTLSSLRQPNRKNEAHSLEEKFIPRLSFTRLSPLIIRDSICIAGFGNTIGRIDLSHT